MWKYFAFSCLMASIAIKVCNASMISPDIQLVSIVMTTSSGPALAHDPEPFHIGSKNLVDHCFSQAEIGERVSMFFRAVAMSVAAEEDAHPFLGNSGERQSEFAIDSLCLSDGVSDQLGVMDVHHFHVRMNITPCGHLRHVPSLALSYCRTDVLTWARRVGVQRAKGRKQATDRWN